MSEMSQIERDIQELEKTRNVLGNLQTLLKEQTYPGTRVMQAVEGMALIANFYQQADSQLKRLKEEKAKAKQDERKEASKEEASSKE